MLPRLVLSAEAFALVLTQHAHLLETLVPVGVTTTKFFLRKLHYNFVSKFADKKTKRDYDYQLPHALPEVQPVVLRVHLWCVCMCVYVFMCVCVCVLCVCV